MTKRVAMVLLLPMLLVASSHAADLDYLVDMRSALIDQLGLSGETNFYTEAKLNRFVNRAIKFVEAGTKSNQRIVRWETVENQVLYTLDDTVSLNGVENVYIVPMEGESKLIPQGLSYKAISEFKFGLNTPQIYTLWAGMLLLNIQPNKSGDSLFAMVYRSSYDLAADSSLVSLPRGARRELALHYAYILALKAAGNFDLAATEWQEWLTRYQLVEGTAFKQTEPLSPAAP